MVYPHDTESALVFNSRVVLATKCIKDIEEKSSEDIEQKSGIDAGEKSIKDTEEKSRGKLAKASQLIVYLKNEIEHVFDLTITKLVYVNPLFFVGYSENMLYVFNSQFQIIDKYNIKIDDYFIDKGKLVVVFNKSPHSYIYPSCKLTPIGIAKTGRLKCAETSKYHIWNNSKQFMITPKEEFKGEKTFESFEINDFEVKGEQIFVWKGNEIYLHAQGYVLTVDTPLEDSSLSSTGEEVKIENFFVNKTSIFINLSDNSYIYHEIGVFFNQEPSTLQVPGKIVYLNDRVVITSLEEKTHVLIT